MATAINNGDIQALLDSFYQLSANIDQRLADMGQQITNLQRQQQPPSSTPTPDTITSTTNGTKDGTSWAADIGYFYPNMPMSWGTGDVIDREDKVYCRGVYGFTDRLKVSTVQKPELREGFESEPGYLLPGWGAALVEWWGKYTHKARLTACRHYGRMVPSPWKALQNSPWPSMVQSRQYAIYLGWR